MNTGTRAARRRRALLVAAAGCAALLGSTGARAATIIQTFTMTAGEAGLIRTLGNLALFDPTKGTLQSVTLLADNTLSGSVSYTNRSGGYVTVELVLNSVMSVSSTNAGINSALGTLGSVTVAGRRECYPPPNRPCTASVPTVSESKTVSLTNAASIASFTGLAGATAPLTMSLGGSGESAVAGGAIRLAPTVNRAGTLTVTYDYLPTVLAAPAPEPATWATMLLGFGAVGGAVRRRSRPTAAA